MSPEEITDAEYQKGFNEGYLMAKHDPELAKDLSKIEKDNSRMQGLKHGIEQFEKEQTKDRLPGWMQRDRFSNLDKDKEKEKGKDDLDRDY